MLTKQYTPDLLEMIQGIRHKSVSTLSAPKLVKSRTRLCDQTGSLVAEDGHHKYVSRVHPTS